MTDLSLAVGAFVTGTIIAKLFKILFEVRYNQLQNWLARRLK
jgi:hypothetical protein